MICRLFEEQISDYLESALGPAERQNMDLHVHSCEPCSRLLAGVTEVMAWGRSFPVHEAPEWLSARIIANTPRLARESWTDTIISGWRWIAAPRVAMGLFTATLVLGWMGSMAGFSPNWSTVVRNPSAIYYDAQGAVNRAYGEALRRYHRSPLVAGIKTRIEQLREIS